MTKRVADTNPTDTLAGLEAQMMALQKSIQPRLAEMSFNEVQAFDEQHIKPLARRISAARSVVTRKAAKGEG